MIVIYVAPRGVERVEVTSPSGALEAFDAFDLALWPVICDSLERLDRRLRRIHKVAASLGEKGAEEPSDAMKPL